LINSEIFPNFLTSELAPGEADVHRNQKLYIFFLSIQKFEALKSEVPREAKSQKKEIIL
jgi:hypothetical protein